MNRYRILNTPVDGVDMDDALEFVDDYVKNSSKPGYILAVNPEKIYVLRENDFLRQFFNNATLLVPDGIGLVKALRFIHKVRVSRVPGADLMQNICAAAPEKKYRIYIFGSSEEVNKRAVDELRRRHPGIDIVGRSNGYVKPEENAQLIEDINASNAEILFIAMGSPRQEKWIYDNINQLTTVKLCQGIGGTLDTIVGHVKRAPDFFQNLGLEWFYRLLKQPSRARRQVRLLYFVIEVLLEKLQGTR